MRAWTSVLTALAAAGAMACAAKAIAGSTPQVGVFNYYVLSLSWSPFYCETHASEHQCSTTQGLVLHGLWPQYDRGGYPDCTGMAPSLDEQARSAGRAIFPNEKLIAHEWDKHGACTDLSATEYFQLGASARQSIAAPPRLAPGNSSLHLTAQELVGLLRAANLQLSTNSFAQSCGDAHGASELAEVLVCLDKKLKPRACGRDVHDSCPRAGFTVPGVR